MRAWIAAVVIGCGACGEDGGAAEVDTGVAETEVVAETGGDVSEETTAETIVDAEIAVETIVDAEVAIETVADAEVAVETNDLGSEVTISGPQGQCGDSWDCPGTLFCADSAPGGICNGCTGNDPCPDGLWCNEFGSCSRDCETRADCPQGMRCHPTQTVCVLEACGDTDDCEAPYVCDGGMCRRPPCGDASCPSPLVCVAGTCLEPYWVE